MRERFEEHGWSIVRGVFDAGRVAELTRVFDRLVGAPPGLRQLPGPHHLDPAFDALLRAPEIGALACDALGAEWVQLLQDGLLVKPAGATDRIEWHQDYTYLAFLEPPATVSVRVALTPSTEATGCLRVLDGSHRLGVLGDPELFGGAIQAGLLEALPPEQRQAERLVELEPGDVSLHHCLTVHGSFENRSPHAQKVVVTHMFDGACRLRAERLTAEQQAWFQTDADGHLIGEGFPVLHRTSR